MAKFVIFALVAMMAVAAFTAPAEDLEIEHLEGGVRLPRATCDLASAFGVADSLCAAGCIAKRFRGGWCEKGVCHCRR